MPFLNPADQETLEHYMYFLYLEIVKYEKDADTLRLIRLSLQTLEVVFDTKLDYESFTAGKKMPEDDTNQNSSTTVPEGAGDSSKSATTKNIRKVTRNDDKKGNSIKRDMGNDKKRNSVKQDVQPQEMPEHERYNNLGSQFLKTMEFDKAEQCFTRALQLNEDDATYWFNRGMANFHLKNFERCIKDCQICARLDNTHSQSHAVIGKVGMCTGSYRLACKAFSLALNIDPENEMYEKWYAQAQAKLEEEGTELPRGNPQPPPPAAKKRQERGGNVGGGR